jgi:hypothetical protein
LDQRRFSPLFPSYRSVFADLLGLRFIVVGVPVEKVDPSLQPGDLTLIAQTQDAYVYENPRALPRVMLLTDWRIADFDWLIANGWPSDVDPRRTVLLKGAPMIPRTTEPGTVLATARLTRYTNTEVDIDVEAPSGGILLLNDVWHPWWRATVERQAARDPEGRCNLPCGLRSARDTHGTLYISAPCRRIRRGYREAQPRSLIQADAKYRSGPGSLRRKCGESAPAACLLALSTDRGADLVDRIAVRELLVMMWAKFSYACGTPRSARQAGDPQI